MGRFEMKYAPLSLETAERVRFVPSLTTVTVAFGTTAPLESWTVPDRD